MKPSWNAPPTQLNLSSKDVHIWRAVLELPSSRVEELEETLSIDERSRAGRFRIERDRSQFVAARGILRLILGCYLGDEPGAFRFCYEKNGKPRLENACGKTGIQFNLSHSEGLALYVFTQDHEVGVDLERIQDLPEMEKIVEQFFSVRERIAFAALPMSEKKETFFSWWTRKEAFTKATGDGLSYPLERLDVSVIGKETADLLGRFGDTNKEARWSVANVKPADQFTGAFVVEGERWHVQYWQWPGHDRDLAAKTGDLTCILSK